MASFSKVFLDFQRSPQTTGLSNVTSYILREMRRDDPTAGLTSAQRKRIKDFVEMSAVTQRDIDSQYAGTLPGEGGRDPFSGDVYDINLPGMQPGEVALNVSQSTPGNQMARAAVSSAMSGNQAGGTGGTTTGSGTPRKKQTVPVTYTAPRVDGPVSPGTASIPIPGTAYDVGPLADPTFAPYNVYSRMRALATPYTTALGTLGDYQRALARGYQPAMGRWMLDPSLPGTGSFAEFLSQPDYVPDTGALRQGFTNIANLLSGRPAQGGSFAQYSQFFDPDIVGREDAQKNLVNAALAASGTPSYFNRAVQSALGNRMNLLSMTDPTQSGINAARAFADWYSGQTGLGAGLPQPALSQTLMDQFGQGVEGSPDSAFNPETQAPRSFSDYYKGIEDDTAQAIPASQYWGDPSGWEQVRQRARV